jgi:hypothetical protein
MTDKDKEEEAERLLGEGYAMNPMGELGVGMHEMFTGLKEGGFTQLEALWIIGYVITGGSSKVEGEETE